MLDYLKKKYREATHKSKVAYEVQHSSKTTELGFPHPKKKDGLEH